MSCSSHLQAVSPLSPSKPLFLSATQNSTSDHVTCCEEQRRECQQQGEHTRQAVGESSLSLRWPGFKMGTSPGTEGPQAREPVPLSVAWELRCLAVASRDFTAGATRSHTMDLINGIKVNKTD